MVCYVQSRCKPHLRSLETQTTKICTDAALGPEGLGLRVLGLGFRVLGLGLRVQGFGFRVWETTKPLKMLGV